jgi:hypothetical protein
MVIDSNKRVKILEARDGLIHILRENRQNVVNEGGRTFVDVAIDRNWLSRQGSNYSTRLANSISHFVSLLPTTQYYQRFISEGVMGIINLGFPSYWAITFLDRRLGLDLDQTTAFDLLSAPIRERESYEINAEKLRKTKLRFEELQCGAYYDRVAQRADAPTLAALFSQHGVRTRELGREVEELEVNLAQWREEIKRHYKARSS